MRRSLGAALAALGLTAVFATPAFAGKPLIETFQETDSFEIACETVTLVEEFSQSVVSTTWFDAGGEPTRGHAHVRFDGTITGPGSTIALSDVGRFTGFVDHGPNGDIERQVGMVYKISAPGHGIIAHDVGVITFFPDGSVDIKGPHDVWDNGLEALVCPLFE